MHFSSQNMGANLPLEASTREPIAASVRLLRLQSCLKHSIAALAPCDSDSDGPHLTSLCCALEEFDKSIPTAHSPSNHGTRRCNYLDLLPEGPMDNIIRHLSERPKRIAWEKHISPNDAQVMYCGTGALSKVFRRKFPNVNVTSDYKAKQVVPSSPVFPVLEMGLLCRTWESGAVKVLRAAGASITGITCSSFKTSDQPPHLVNWINPFLKHCNNIRRLDARSILLPFFEKIIQKCAPTLQSLELDSNTSTTAHIECVARHCSQLRRFSAALRATVPPLLWRTVGATLEELHFSLTEPHLPVLHGSYYAGTQDMVRDIETHCRKIRWLAAFPVCSAMYPALASLAGSYGEQLEYAKLNFSYMASDLCRSIAGKCPNAEFELTCLTRMSVMEELNFQVHKLSIFDVTNFAHPDFDTVAVRCDKLRALSLRRLEENAPYIIAKLFSEPKPHLTELTICLKHNNAPQVFLELGNCVRTLKAFNLKGTVLHREVFRPFILANKGLKSVDVEVCGQTKEDAEKTALEFLDVCKEHESIREFEFSAFKPRKEKERVEKIADACTPMRVKNIHVRIFGFTYM